MIFLEAYNKFNNFNIIIEICKNSKYRKNSLIKEYILDDKNDLTIISNITNNNLIMLGILYNLPNELIKLLIDSKKINLNHQNWNDKTALILSYNKNNFEIFYYLLKNGADPNIKEKNGNVILHKICFYNNIKYYNELIKYKNVDVNIQNSDGDTPLIISILRNAKDIFNKLLNVADWFILDKDGKCFFDYLNNSEKEKLKIKYPIKYKKILRYKNLNKFNI